jgi:hypothetical protein
MFPLIGPEMIEAWACRPKECGESAEQIESSQGAGGAAIASYAGVKTARWSLSSLSANLRWMTRNRAIIAKIDRNVFRRLRK